MFRLELDLYSYADLHRPGLLADLGRAFDADPGMRIERMDVRDPLRNTIANAEDYLSGADDLLDTEIILFERRRDPHLDGELAASYRLDELRDAPHRLFANTNDGDEAWFRDPGHVDAFAGLFARLAGAFDASYGFAADYQMARQQEGEFIRMRRLKHFAPAPPGPESDLHAVRDVYWLNYFGPAYLEMWGDRLSGLGVRQVPTSNGGLVVQATETPFVFEESIASFADYAWKKPFHEALGLETFVNARTASWERRVPSRADHVRAAAARSS